jgi:hypothetical protein
MEIIIAIVGIIGALAGTYLGYFLSERATRERQERADKEQAQAVRTLLEIEITYNLARLRDFWDKVNQPDTETDSFMVALNKAIRLMRLPTPNWSHRAWESQMPLLPMALKDEKLIREIHAHHAIIFTLDAIHNKLSLLKIEQDREMGMTRDNPFPAAVFQRNAPNLMTEYEAGVSKLIERGNPLEKQDSQKGDNWR